VVVLPGAGDHLEVGSYKKENKFIAKMNLFSFLLKLSFNLSY